MRDPHPDRRRFFAQTAGMAGAFALAGCADTEVPVRPPMPDLPAAPVPPPHGIAPAPAGPRLAYNGTNVVVIRFGGGVRRRETVRKDVTTYCPFVTHELGGKHGTLFDNVEIGGGAVTSHGQNTLYMLTGAYDHYHDIYNEPFKDRFEAVRPTLFEYLRATYDIPSHRTLIVNGEDRADEEFFTFSNHHNYGVQYRSETLSLFRFKTYLLRQQLERECPVPFEEWKFVEKVAARPGHPARGKFTADHPAAKEWAEKREKLYEMESKDYRKVKGDASPEMEQFWADWRAYYGDSGLTCPRGDRVLTELSLRALKTLRPRLMMVNYQDPDYVHWGPASFYTRAIAVIDDGVRQLWNAVQNDDFYRGNTVFVIMPDCGRDDNRLTNVPYQHHFGSRCAHEIFAVMAGPGIARGLRVDKRHEQIDVAATVGRLMGFGTAEAGSDLLGEAFS